MPVKNGEKRFLSKLLRGRDTHWISCSLGPRTLQCFFSEPPTPPPSGDESRYSADRSHQQPLRRHAAVVADESALPVVGVLPPTVEGAVDVAVCGTETEVARALIDTEPLRLTGRSWDTIPTCLGSKTSNRPHVQCRTTNAIIRVKNHFCSRASLPTPHPPHTMIVAIRDVQRPILVDHAPMRPVHPRFQRVAAVAFGALAAAGDGCHHPRLAVDLADRVVLRVHDVDVALAVAADR